MEIKRQFFSHIYVERQVLHHPETQKILERFPLSEKVYISHYKDVFNRKHQSFYCQKQSPALVLAGKRGVWCILGHRYARVSATIIFIILPVL